MSYFVCEARAVWNEPGYGRASYAVQRDSRAMIKIKINTMCFCVGGNESSCSIKGVLFVCVN